MSRKITTASQTDAGELTPLSDRLSLLLVVRLFMASVVLIASAKLPQLTLHDSAVLAAQAYIGVALFFEMAHRLLTRRTNKRWLVIVNIMLLVDGIFIATVLAGSGQSRSAFMFLAYAHIVSVTLLVSFRTGLKLALWHSILLLSVYYLGLAGLLPLLGLSGQSTDRNLTNELEVAQATALWLVAIVTASFASLNERELRRRKGELTIIADLSTKIEETRRPSEILQALVDVTTEKMNCTRALALASNGKSVVVVGSSADTSSLKGQTLVTMGGVVSSTTASGTPTLLRKLDAGVDAFLASALPDARNVAVIPLVAEGETVAVLVAEWGTKNRTKVTRQTIDLLSNVAGRVALSLSNTFLLAEVQRLASVDGLTGLPNRRTFNTALDRELARAQRSGRPVSLVMLDIDHFKSVNDNHGHQTGDQVLAESAGGVMRACRGEDLPARYGGEEMAVIMPNCSAEQALAAADRIRVALADANVTLKTVTASAGVATFPNDATDVTSLLAAADSALYASKESGRNRTTAASERSTAVTESVTPTA